ncbi:ATP-grasp ribosomal peptide maturase [Kribbella antibiotica]|uniref:ATP-grasp ribosomal peptide maturase n=1 Tax=Kribbella antibiotica TaxID=190195 RepID=A0A4R4ZJG6_9ACTN|nr:ATP-grasp ribosomal peptide maturase [Kribbella antibiotica]
MRPRSGPSPRVLVLTEVCDPTADFVLEHLNQRGVGFWRLDPGDFPDSIDLSAGFDGAWFGELLGPLRLVELAEVRAVYFRRPSGFKTPAGLPESEADFIRSQARHALFGILAGLPRVTWLNNPGRMADARVKPYQLAIAAQVGLSTPKTLVTNRPDDVVAFGKRVGRIVTKSLSTILYESADEGTGVLYTAEVPESDWGHPGIAATAHLFQEVVERDYEVRLTYVDGQFFAAAIMPDDPDGAVDIRAHKRAVTYRETRVPDQVRTAISEMMKRLGLLFGAFDFIVTPDGRWTFIEVNPNGQWAWIEQETGLPISAALADILEKGAVE